MNADLVEDIFPLSPMQQGLLFESLATAGSGVYVEQVSCKLTGDLDWNAFERSWRLLVERHGILRTAFVWEDLEEPVQVVHREVELPLHRLDWSELSTRDQKSRLEAFLREDRQRGFEPTEAPLMRLTLIDLADDTYQFVWSHHHVLMDGWCNALLLKELLASYRAFSSGSDLKLPPAGSYRDYIAWLQEQDDTEVETFWRRKLTGFTEPTTLGIDRSVKRSLTDYAEQDGELSEKVTSKLRALAQQHQLTLNTLVQGAWTLLLRRYSDRDDVVYGTVVSGRPSDLEGVDSIVGLFINTLPVRARVSDGEALLPWLKGLQAQHSELRQYEHSPLSQVQAWSDVPAGTSLFDTLLAYENYPIDRTAGGQDYGIRVDEFHLAEQVSYPLTMIVIPGAGLNIRASYYRSRYGDDAIRRLLAHFSNLLEAMADHPEQTLREVNMLSRDEMQQWFGDPDRSRAEFPVEKCLHEWFEAHVERAPDAVAAVFEGAHLTYDDLNRRANQLAHRLRESDVGPETLVGLCLERGLEMIVGVLGILKAGGAYVPLDPDHPAQRLSFMQEDAKLSVIVTEERFASRLPQKGAQLVCLDADEDEISGQSGENPSGVTTPQNLAYVIYTSGSTGQPKGTLITHENVARLFTATENWFQIGNRDIWTLFHSFAFDFSVWEIWGALLYGGKLVVVPYEVTRSPEAFDQLLRCQRVTVLNQTPSAFRQLIRAGDGIDTERAALALRLVIFGGEALEIESLRPWIARHGDERPRLINMYGITETTVHVTYRPLTRKELDEAHGSLIGAPIPDLQVYVLDRCLRPAPIGVPGEAYVRGAGVARGYVSRPNLTAERFIPSPFDSRRGVRLYRTGDSVRVLSNGELEFLGRVDQQVKIRGFRIELGEIESALKKHATVRDAAVLAREDEPGEKRLVAYVVPEKGFAPTFSELRHELAKELPHYSIPSAFVVLDSLPLTTNGKLDRRALPAPSRARPDLHADYVEPKTPLQRELAELFQEILHVDKVGLHDNYFELGGDSIKAVSLFNKLQARLQHVIHVVAIFDAPTVFELARFLRRNYRDSVVTLFGESESEDDDLIRGQAGRQTDELDATTVTQMRNLTAISWRGSEAANEKGPKNPQAIFVLCPPRSGSTLLRVMLGGHPELFAPPELDLLSFQTLRERKQHYFGRKSFWLEGTMRAVMELKKCSGDESRKIMEEYEHQDLTTREFYRLMQDWMGDRRLVDKSPSYALDIGILKRAEAWFENPLYIHLQRHPCGMIRSFQDVRLDQVFYPFPHDMTRRALAELMWTLSNQNIVDFLKSVPAERRMIVRFEDLVNQPEPIVAQISEFLGIGFRTELLDPYDKKSQRMTDGVHPLSRMLGDEKFLQHESIDRKIADRWRETDPEAESRLGEPTWEMAEAFGYERPEGTRHKRLREGSFSPASLIPIEAMSRRSDLPLSFAQRRLWFIDQLAPGNPVYNVPMVLRAKGRIDLDALRRSVNEIVRRHEVLRTSFPRVDGAPVQVIAPTLRVPMEEVDLSGFPSEEREREARRLADIYARDAFDLSQGPLIRGGIFRLDEDDHVLVLTLHHIVCDGWSFDVLMREAVMLYMAYSQGQESPLIELPIQYADFAAWQQRMLQGSTLEGQLQYWREQLKDIPTLELPTDRPRPAVQTHRGQKYVFRLPAELSRELSTLSGREDGTLFVTLLAAFQVLLHHYSRQEDICVGSPTANRNRKEIEGLIGFFVNMLVMRSDLSGNPTFREHLSRVRKVALRALANQDVPFELLVQELHPERDLSREPLFQVTFAMQNVARSVFTFPNLELERLHGGLESAYNDLTLFMWENEDAIAGSFVYSTDLFDETTIERMAGHLQTLLEGIVRNPDERIGNLPLLGADERRQLVTEWGRSRDAQGSTEEPGSDHEEIIL